MRIEYIPYKDRPDIRFEFALSEIDAAFAEYLIYRRAGPEFQSPHKQILREAEERLAPFVEAQAELQRIITQERTEPVAWADIAGWMQSWHIADLLEGGYGVALCPACQDVYSISELALYDWKWSNHAGRMFTCPRDHELYRSFERIYEFMEPQRPFERTLRKKRLR